MSNYNNEKLIELENQVTQLQADKAELLELAEKLAELSLHLLGNGEIHRCKLIINKHK